MLFASVFRWVYTESYFVIVYVMYDISRVMYGIYAVETLNIRALRCTV